MKVGPAVTLWSQASHFPSCTEPDPLCTQRNEGASPSVSTFDPTACGHKKAKVTESQPDDKTPWEGTVFTRFLAQGR